MTAVNLKKWIKEIAHLLEGNIEPTSHEYLPFLQEPGLALELINLLGNQPDTNKDEEEFYYSACIFALDICVAQLQSAAETGNKLANKILHQLMTALSAAINAKQHSLSFWLPVLNAFYEVHVELSPELKNAYLNLAAQEEDFSPVEEGDHLNTIREMIKELADLSIFDIAENFFAQSYAMPADFFADLLIDLYSIDEGEEIALLLLLHPKEEVRRIVLATFEQLIDTVKLSPASLSRLEVIKSWYPTTYHNRFNQWIKIQRKKGVVFKADSANVPTLKIKASEVDGSGAQGIFIYTHYRRQNRLCGLLLKQDYGIKDAWITPNISAKEVNRYYSDAFDDTVSLREVDLNYLTLIAEHFLAVTLDNGKMPTLQLLEMQELLHLHFQPNLIDSSFLIEQLSVQISPFTPIAMEASFKRSKGWKGKHFTESWYVEDANVDKLVNRSCSIVDGIKICDLDKAKDAVFAQELEKHRDKWLFHFLWVALWAKSKARRNEKIWQDSFFIAYAIHEGDALNSIPIMHAICHQTVVNSIETMTDRKTYLNKE